MNKMETIIGDILTPNTEDKLAIVCHQVNCKGVMGAGLAKQIRDKFPVVYDTYKEKCALIQNGHGGLGDVQFCGVLSEEDAGYIIANVFGQDGYGRDKCYTDYNALYRAFTDIAFFWPNATIRIPYLFGCGLAGGDWNTVTSIIQKTLVSRGVNVEIWKLPSVAKAEEEAERKKKMAEENENYSIWDV